MADTVKHEFNIILPIFVSDNGCKVEGCAESGIPLQGTRLCTTHAEELGYCVCCGHNYADNPKQLERIEKYGLCGLCLE